MLLVNGSKAITCHGKICQSNNQSNLTIMAYVTYYQMKQLLSTTNPINLTNNIIMLDGDQTLMARLHKLNRKIYPNACLLPDSIIKHTQHSEFRNQP
jgi:hypothetical protein